MTVRIEKPAINVREELADLRKPTGIAGEAMLRAETPQEQQALIGVGRRNVIINGNFDIWQRGTSVANNNSINYSADRWATFSNGAGDTSLQSFIAGQTDVTGEPEYFLRWSITSYVSGDHVRQKIENVRTLAGQSFTLSFYAKASSAVTSTPILIQNFGSGGSSEVNTNLTSTALTTSWQKFTVTGKLPSISGKTINSANHLRLELVRLTSSFTGSIDIAQVQLEVGKVATPFEHRSYGEELALCQRYCQVIGGDSAFNQMAFGFAFSSTRCDVKYIAPTTFRAIPTLSTSGQWDVTDGSTGSDVSSFNIAGLQSSRYIIEIQASATGMTANRFVRVESENSTAVTATFDAEL